MLALAGAVPAVRVVAASVVQVVAGSGAQAGGSAEGAPLVVRRDSGRGAPAVRPVAVPVVAPGRAWRDAAVARRSAPAVLVPAGGWEAEWVPG